MARQRFDMGSKWLLHHHGKSTLHVGGLKNVRHCQPMPGEIIQNRRFPDGLLQAFLVAQTKPHHVLAEIATYPERRALKQALDDVTLAYSALGHLPEMLMFVLRPKGRFRIEGKHSIRSELGTSRLTVEWKTVELWTLPAEQFLAEGDVGMMPWVPLMQFDGPAESLLERCADRIEREAEPRDRTDLQVISQVMADLRFSNLNLSAIFGGSKAMIESPFLQRERAGAVQKNIREILKDRFGAVPRDVAEHLSAVVNEKSLTKLSVLSAKCANLDAFREALKS